MRKFTNPLDNIHVASPCSANWNEMYGNDRKRFCGDCKLNVYNLSDMTRQEAENLLMNSEGRLCVRFFRRADGTVLTKNCPVGWQAVKRRVSRVATAVFSMITGVFGGIFAFSIFEERPQYEEVGSIVTSAPLIVGDVAPQYIENRSNEVKGEYVFGEITTGKPVIVVKPHKPEPRQK